MLIFKKYEASRKKARDKYEAKRKGTDKEKERQHLLYLKRKEKKAQQQNNNDNIQQPKQPEKKKKATYNFKAPKSIFIKWRKELRQLKVQKALLDGKRISNMRICKTAQEKREKLENWRNNNREKINEYYRKYNSKETTKQKEHIYYLRKKQEREENPELLAEYRKKHNAQNKRYRESKETRARYLKLKQLEKKKHQENYDFNFFKRRLKQPKQHFNFSIKRFNYVIGDILTNRKTKRNINYYLLRLYVEKCMESKETATEIKQYILNKWNVIKLKIETKTKKNKYENYILSKEEQERQDKLEKEADKLLKQNIILINVDAWNKRIIESWEKETNKIIIERNNQLLKDLKAGKITYL